MREPVAKHLPAAAIVVLLAGCSDGAGGLAGAGFADTCAIARQTVARGEALEVDYGFFADFNPLSYAAARNPASPEFNRPLGYEPSLVAAVETFSRGQLVFNPLGIGNPFAGIWLKAAESAYDVVGGGITSLPERMLDDSGREAVRFGTGHVNFRQSLLVNADSTIARHGDLNNLHVVGLLRGTTGEARLLELTGIVDAGGHVAAGTVVVLEDSIMLVAGEPGDADAFRITSAGSSAAIATRTQLLPVNVDQPAVRYYGNEGEQIQALQAREVDAVARGEIGNLIAVRENPDAFRVTAVDTTATERGAFSYAATPAGDALREKMDAVILCLTDDGAVGISDWLDDRTVFARRAETLR